MQSVHHGREGMQAGARLCLLGQEEQKAAGSHLCKPEGSGTRLQRLEVLQLDPTSQNSTSGGPSVQTHEHLVFYICLYLH